MNKIKNKVKYEVDPFNRLVIKGTGRKTKLRHFRKVVDGYFRIEKDNVLVYHIKKPVPQGLVVPHQIKLKGKWSLTRDHNLRISLDKWGNQSGGNTLTFSGNILDVKKNSLLFALTTKTQQNTDLTYILELTGSWQTDKFNRITFFCHVSILFRYAFLFCLCRISVCRCSAAFSCDGSYISLI